MVWSSALICTSAAAEQPNRCASRSSCGRAASAIRTAEISDSSTWAESPVVENPP